MSRRWASRPAGDPAAGVAPAEADDLDRQPEARSQPVHELRLLGHHEAAGRRGDDLLPQQSTAAALQQSETGVDLVGAVDRDVELEAAVEGDHLDVRGVDDRVGRVARDRHPQVGPRPEATHDRLYDRPHGPARAKADRHAGLEQLGGSLRGGCSRGENS